MGPVLSDNILYSAVHNVFIGFLPGWLAFLLTGAVLVFLLLNVVLLVTTGLTWAERRLLGRFQSRIGPNRWGPFGLLQPIGDAIKLLFKEDIVPREADRWVFNLAPVVLLAPILIIIAVIPLGFGTYMVDLNVGVLYVVAAGALETLGVFMAGWGSGNRYALFGAGRSVATLISYEVPLVLSLVGVLLWTGSMSLVEVVEAQRVPFFLLQPLGFVVFLVATMAELNRPPFDLAEAESELVAGFNTEYSGMKFGILYLAETAGLVVEAGFATALFLKGWAGWDFLPSQVWFLLKWALVVFVAIWVRATLPRLRVDQMMALAWKFLFPLAVLNIVVLAVEGTIWPDPTTGQLWVLVLVNLVITVLAIVGLANVLGHRRYTPAIPLRPRPATLRR